MILALLGLKFNTAMNKSQLDACTTRAFIKIQKNNTKFSHLLPIKFVIKYKNPFIHGTLMRKNAVLDIGMYDENIKYAQDYKLFIELLKKIKNKNLKSKLYILNMENNISSLKKEEQHSFSRKIQRKIYENKYWLKNN